MKTQKDKTRDQLSKTIDRARDEIRKSWPEINSVFRFHRAHGETALLLTKGVTIDDWET